MKGRMAGRVAECPENAAMGLSGAAGELLGGGLYDEAAGLDDDCQGTPVGEDTDPWAEVAA